MFGDNLASFNQTLFSEHASTGNMIACYWQHVAGEELTLACIVCDVWFQISCLF